MENRLTANKDNIKWSPNIAYAVGLITTDGSLSSDKRHITFVSKDIALIITFKYCLGLNNRIRPKKSGFSERLYYKVQFGNVKLYRWLLKIGLTPNKTKTIGKLDVPKKYLPDFLRGHLDGDGCLRSFQDPVYRNSKRLYTVFYSASLKHLEWMQKSIKGLLRIKGWIEPGRNVYRLTYAKSDSKILLPFLYYNKNVPFLGRKRNIIKSFL